MKKNILIYSFLFSLLFTVSCKKDFEEINKNPNGFTTASDGSLFNATISSLQSGWNEQLYVNNEVLYKQTEQAALPQVRWNNYSIGTEDIWSNFYTSLPNFRELEKRFKAKDTTAHTIINMMAMEKIVLAYKAFKVTDLFGDIPFFDAGYGFQDVTKLHPKFDSQESIYKFLLDELKWAAENLDASAAVAAEEPFHTFTTFDKLFAGDVTKWKKFANSLRLRYAMRMVNKEPVLAGQILKDVIDNHKPTFGVTEFGQLNDDPDECAILLPFKLGYRNESKGWSFNQGKDLRMGSTIWHLMSTNDSLSGAGIFDPRAYYFFDTNINSHWKSFPNDSSGIPPDGGLPYDYQRDLYYNLKGQACLYSPVNYYFARDEDHMPDVLITGAEVLFIRAEAYLLNIGVTPIAGQADNEFLSGVQFSVDFWDHVMSGSKLPTGIAFSVNISVPSNVNFFSIQNNIHYFTGNAQEKLKEIYAQEWIDFFKQPQEAFALARRTGLTPREGPALSVYSFPIPPTEVSYNQANWLNNIGSSPDNLNQKVWWMN